MPRSILAIGTAALACAGSAATTSTIPLSLDEWPSGTCQYHYQQHGLLLGSRRQLPKYDRTHRLVPLMFLQNLFSRAYWDHFVDPESLGPLFVPTAGTWYADCKVTPREISTLPGKNFPKDALWDIVMDEVAACSRTLTEITNGEDDESVEHVPLRNSIDSGVSATELTEAVEVDQPVALIGWAEEVKQPVAVVKKVVSGKPVVVTPPVAVESHHRTRVSRVTTSKDLWALRRWTKNKDIITPTFTPTLLRPGGEEVKDTQGKADLLKSVFFPQPPEAQEDDINHFGLYDEPV